MENYPKLAVTSWDITWPHRRFYRLSVVWNATDEQAYYSMASTVNGSLTVMVGPIPETMAVVERLVSEGYAWMR